MSYTLDYSLVRYYRSKGLATEMLNKTLHYLSQKLNAKNVKLIAEIKLENKASIKSLKEVDLK